MHSRSSTDTLVTISIPCQEKQEEVDARRQQAKHRNSSFWKNVGKFSAPEMNPELQGGGTCRAAWRGGNRAVGCHHAGEIKQHMFNL